MEGAEAAYRRGDERGNGPAAYGLGVLLRQLGREAEAQAAYRALRQERHRPGASDPLSLAAPTDPSLAPGA